MHTILQFFKEEASIICQKVKSELYIIIIISLQLLNIYKIRKSTLVDFERTVSEESEGGKENLTFQR